MTKEELSHANIINEQIETLEKFLAEDRMCWSKIKFFATPSRQKQNITLRTSYGHINDEISASERLSASIIKAIEDELFLLKHELDSIGRASTSE